MLPASKYLEIPRTQNFIQLDLYLILYDHRHGLIEIHVIAHVITVDSQYLRTLNVSMLYIDTIFGKTKCC